MARIFHSILGLSLLAFVFLAAVAEAPMAQQAYRVLGQPDLASVTLASRCSDRKARFNFSNDGGFEMFGPAGIAIDPRGRMFVTDYGGKRVMTWPQFGALKTCSVADAIIGKGDLQGPEAVVFDAKSNALFVADTLDHTVKGYRKSATGWKKFVTLGKSSTPGAAFNRFNFPRGLAVDSRGRLFVADDFNNRVLIFNAPFSNGEQAADSIFASLNGSFSGPKALAMTGDTLFVADYNNNRVLRFTGPFNTPAQSYAASAVFSGVAQPVDIAIHPSGELLVSDNGNQRIARYEDAIYSDSQFAPTSAFNQNIGPEALGIAADRKGRIYIADYRRYRVLIRDEFVKTSPVNASASPTAKALLANLHKRAGKAANRVAVGQQLITFLYGAKSDPKKWYRDWLQMISGGYPLPEIMGGELSDLETYPGFAPNKNALKELIRHGRAGHIVTLVWHPSVPVAGGNFNKPVSTAQLFNMVNGGTATGQRWQVELDRAAAVLQQFEDAGVPVLFRPLHEQNGTFFWWGHNGATGLALAERQRAWVGMWRDMVSEMTTVKGLSNVVFVFGTNQVNYREVAPPLTYYPGAASADVVSIDVYDEQLDLGGSRRGKQHYTALIGTGKPFGFAEVGQSFGNNGTGANGAAWDARTLTARVRDSYRRMAFAIFWYSSFEGGKRYVFAIPDVSAGKRMLNHPLIDTQ